MRLILLVVAALAAAPVRAELRGPAAAVDGDTLDVGGHRIRLFGVDAPETAQTCGGTAGAWRCGEAAAARLDALVAGREVTCAPRDRDAYGRIVATCAADGIDLGGALASEGLAWAYVRYADDYVAAEDAARAAGLGVWAGEAAPAWEWRATEGFRAAAGAAPPDVTTDAPPPDGCTIKGNVNVKGERIYHTPASPWYGRVRIDPARGQRWFCSEAEAEAAGWRGVR